MTHPHLKENFVQKEVLIKSGIKTLNTVGQNFSKAAVSVNTARPINIAYPRPTVNSARTASNVFNKAHKHVRRPFNKSTTNKNSNLKEKVNTVKGNVTTVGPKAVVSVNKGNEANFVKASACWVWRLNQKGNPQLELQEKRVIDSGCSRHMTGNKSYLSDYEEIDGGFVAFGGDSKGGRITGKGKISTDKLDFEDVYFVKELKFNLFSVSQICDKKNSVLFTDTKCVVLSPDFKLLNKNHVLLKVPRKDNMYSVDLKNNVTSGGLTCLFAKATLDESNLWHRRLRPTFVKSLMKKMYCLVVTNDYSRFSWVFFLASKDETSEILKIFIIGIENLIDLKVKVIRCDNGTEFKNNVMNQFCEMKGIKREFSVARTPQQNGRKPALSLMRPFGCPVTILNTLDQLGKFDRKADEGFFVGYSTNSKAYRVFNSRTMIVEENLHVKFSTKENIGTSLDGKKTVPDQKYILLPLVTSDPLLSKNSKDSPDAGFKPSGEEEKIDSEHQENKDSEVPNTQEPKINQEQDANVNSTNNINIVSLTVNAADIENNAIDENIVYGCIDDPNMPNLEEIVYSGDDDEVGAEADMNNLARTIPVSPIPTTRVHKDHPLEQIIGDIQSAPQTRRMTKNVTKHVKPKKTLVDLPYGKRAISTKWVYKNKKDDRGIVVRNKTILVAQGYTHEEGIDYDEVFAPIAKIEAIRLFLAYALFIGFIVYHMDVKSAFLYGTNEEEVYVCQPLSFEDP
ncbi:retrovirus-related pol polyprotein from transposon TNT 1-94 [Tanacetum coccineum]